jgi:hypothetical protein
VEALIQELNWLLIFPEEEEAIPGEQVAKPATLVGFVCF